MWYRRLTDRLILSRLRRRRRAGPSAGTLLVSAGGLGDMVLFSLVFTRFASLAKAGEKVSLLLRQDAAKMGFLFAPESEIRTVDFSRLGKSAAYRRQVCRDLYDRHYRLVVSTDFLRHPFLDELLIEACHADETIAMEPRAWAKYDRALKSNRRIYTRLLDGGPVHRDKVLRWVGFADRLCGETRPAPRVSLPGDRLAEAIRPQRPTLVLMPFSAVKAKQSPMGLYEKIIAALPDGWRTVMAGGPGDLERNPEFRVLLERPGVTFDGASFEALVPTLRGASLVVSVDTAGMHLAVALGAPTLCLASAAYVGEIVPYAPEITPDNVRFLHQSMDCQGCLGDCPFPPEAGMYPCVAALDAERVLAEMQALLGGEGGLG